MVRKVGANRRVTGENGVRSERRPEWRSWTPFVEIAGLAFLRLRPNQRFEHGGLRNPAAIRQSDGKLEAFKSGIDNFELSMYCNMHYICVACQFGKKKASFVGWLVT